MTEPKNGAESVVQDWVSACSFREQTVLLVALRGCDTLGKNSPGKELTRAVRRIVLKNAMRDTGTFMLSGAPNPVPPDMTIGEISGEPLHWWMHMVHAAEVIGYRHPDPSTRHRWHQWYDDACVQLHLSPETEKQMQERLKGDFGPVLHPVVEHNEVTAGVADRTYSLLVDIRRRLAEEDGDYPETDARILKFFDAACAAAGIPFLKP